MFVYVKVGMVVLRWRKQLLSVDRHSNQVNTTRPEYAMNSFPTSPPPQRNSEVTIFSQAPNGEEHRRQLSVPQSPYYIEEAIPTDHGHGRFASTQDDAFVDRQSTVVNEEPLVKKVDVKKAAMSYFKTALLFFLALLCTWYVCLCLSPVQHAWSHTDYCTKGTIDRQPTLHPLQTERPALRARIQLRLRPPAPRVLEHGHLHRDEFPGLQSSVGRYDGQLTQRYRQACYDSVSHVTDIVEITQSQSKSLHQTLPRPQPPNPGLG